MIRHVPGLKTLEVAITIRNMVAITDIPTSEVMARIHLYNTDNWYGGHKH